MVIRHQRSLYGASMPYEAPSTSSRAVHRRVDEVSYTPCGAEAFLLVPGADVLLGTCIPFYHRSERQIARMIQRLLKNAMR
jgi:hypothetical protein